MDVRLCTNPSVYISLSYLALATYHIYEIEQMDVVTSFLNANVVSEIYMDQPQGFGKTTKDGG